MLTPPEIPYVVLDGVKTAPFKIPGIKPFGPFANTANYPVTQTFKIHGQPQTVKWPSSEHAYHAQKIIFLKNKLPAKHPAQATLSSMLDEIKNTKGEYNPRKHYDALVNKYLPTLNSFGLSLKDKTAFDALCECDFHAKFNPHGGKRGIEFMQRAVSLKLDQYPELAELAMQCAREGVLPIEVSRHDSNWASGRDGKGKNTLGILIYDEGKRRLRAKGEAPAAIDPIQQYWKISDRSKSFDALGLSLMPHAPTWKVPIKSGDMKTFHSDSSKYNKDPHKQAQAIWKEQVEPLLKQGKPVGLIYAANDGQAQGLRSGYRTGKVDGVIQGGGQAPVYAEIAKMIEKRGLQDKVHILPVATSMHGGDNTLPGNTVGLPQINRDLANIASHKAAGWEVRGIADPNGRGYAIGGGKSLGWYDPNNANIMQLPNGSYQQSLGGGGGISQGQYVQNQLHVIASQPQNQWPQHLQPLPVPLSNKTTPANKWTIMHGEEERKSMYVDGSFFRIKDIEDHLQRGEIPLSADEEKTCLDHFVKDTKDDSVKMKAANLLAVYSVKHVMRDLSTQVDVKMVASNNPKLGYPQAMKIQFKSQAEAQAFAEKLLKVHGVHSSTFGKGVQKTPQNGAIYLTPEDLEKISQSTKMSSQPGTGKTAFNAIEKGYQQQQDLSAQQQESHIKTPTLVRSRN